MFILPQPGECGSIINTGNDNGNIFTLQKDILECDCTDTPALTLNGQSIVLNLNGYTVECSNGPNSNDAVIEVLGTANKVLGPGTGEFVYRVINTVFL